MIVGRHTSWQMFPCLPVVMTKGAGGTPRLPLELKGPPALR